MYTLVFIEKLTSYMSAIKLNVCKYLTVTRESTGSCSDQSLLILCGTASLALLLCGYQ